LKSLPNSAIQSSQTEEYDFSEDSIILREDGSFLIRGDADLEDCDTILHLKLSEEDALKDFATLSGFLCMLAGEIPNVGDFVMTRGYSFETIHGDDKRILQVRVDRLIGAFDEESELDTDQNENTLRGFLKSKLGVDDEVDETELDSEVDDQLAQTRAANKEAAKAIELIVEGDSKKADLVEKALETEQKVVANDKKIPQIRADRLIGAFDEEFELDADQNENALRGFLKSNLGVDDEVDEIELDPEVDDQRAQTHAANKEATKALEQIVEGDVKKADLIEKELESEQKVVKEDS
jgi:hypothetical protein